jgi:protein FrlC
VLKLSLSSFVYYNYSLEDAIQHTASAGFDGIDIWGGRPHAYRQDLGEKELKNLIQLLRDVGLSVASFIPAQFRYPTCLCSPNETIRKDSVRYIQDSIETAAALGAPVVSVCPGHTLYGQSREDAIQRLGESLWAICQFAARHQIRIAIEPADRYETDLLNTCQDSLKLVRELGLMNLGVLMDNGHAYVMGEPAAEAVKQMADKLFHVHIDDNDGLRDQHLVPGEGNFDFKPFIQALRDVDYDGFLGVELGWDYTIDPDSAANLTVERMREILTEN